MGMYCWLFNVFVEWDSILQLRFCFDGVDSVYYVWFNGFFVGYL